MVILSALPVPTNGHPAEREAGISTPQQSEGVDVIWAFVDGASEVPLEGILLYPPEVKPRAFVQMVVLKQTGDGENKVLHLYSRVPDDRALADHESTRRWISTVGTSQEQIPSQIFYKGSSDSQALSVSYGAFGTAIAEKGIPLTLPSVSFRRDGSIAAIKYLRPDEVNQFLSEIMDLIRGENITLFPAAQTQE